MPAGPPADGSASPRGQPGVDREPHAKDVHEMKCVVPRFHPADIDAHDPAPGDQVQRLTPVPRRQIEIARAVGG